MEWGVTLTQSLPFFGKRGLKGDVAEHDARVARAQYLLVMIDVAYAVKAAYYEYYRLSGVAQVLVEEKRVLDRMEEVAQVKYASGLVGQQDVLKAQLELSQVEDDLAVNRRDIGTVTARLVELLNLDPRATLPPPAPPAPAANLLTEDDPDSLFAWYGSKRPEIAAATIGEQKADQSISLAKRQYYPDLTLGVQYIKVGERDVDVPDNGKDIWQVMAAVDVPIWFGQVGSGVDEARADQARARSERTVAEVRVRSEIRDGVDRVATAEQRVELYEGVILPQARQAFESAEAGYQTGKIDFLNYLDSERVLLTARKKYHGVVAELGTQRAYLERVLGLDTRYADGERN